MSIRIFKNNKTNLRKLLKNNLNRNLNESKTRKKKLRITYKWMLTPTNWTNKINSCTLKEIYSLKWIVNGTSKNMSTNAKKKRA